MSPTVLLVDDSPDLLEVMGLVMQSQGIGHLDAKNLAEVASLEPRLHDVTLAIVDVNLGPDQPNGVEVSRWLRSHDVRCPIVFLTGHAMDHPLVVEAAGADGRVLAKPIETRELVRLARDTA